VPLHETTPPSSRRRWSGTRHTFVDIVASVENCLGDGGEASAVEYIVMLDDHEGTVRSADQLRGELSEGLWLAARKVHIHLHPKDDYHALSAGVILGRPEPVLFIVYGGGDAQSREVVRTKVERVLPPDKRDPRPHSWWLGPIAGLAWLITTALAGSRSLQLRSDLHLSSPARTAVEVGFVLLDIAIGVYLIRTALEWLSPALERLPDTGASRWDRWRGSVHMGLAIWVTVIVGLLALHPVQLHG